jgi:hypothetical protein
LSQGIWTGIDIATVTVDELRGLKVAGKAGSATLQAALDDIVVLGPRLSRPANTLPLLDPYSQRLRRPTASTKAAWPRPTL